jgi:hypothetical protein
MSSQVQKGIVNVGYTSASAHLLFTSPRPATSCDNGRKSSVGGTRYVRKMPMPSVPEPGNFVRDSTYAAGTQMSTVMMTTARPTWAVFETHVLKFVRSKRYRTWSNEGGRWNNSGLFSRL